MSQLNLFNQGNPKTHYTLNGGEYIHIDNFFGIAESKQYLEVLTDTIKWKQESMQMYGKQVLFPRLTAWYGDTGMDYSFSGITFEPHPWTQELLSIKSKIETQTVANFNSVLLNRYRGGQDSMSWHTDAEKELGRNPVIASVNFGASRKFQLKHMQTDERVEILLTHGSLLIMQGEMQHHWLHQVPKTKKKIGERINLTFRVIHPV